MIIKFGYDGVIFLYSERFLSVVTHLCLTLKPKLR